MKIVLDLPLTTPKFKVRKKDFLQKFLVILVRFALISLVSGCISQSHQSREMIDTEIFCPRYSIRFLLLNTNRKDAVDAIEKAVTDRKIRGDNSKNSILRFSKGRSTMLENIPPEHLRECYFNERPIN